MCSRLDLQDVDCLCGHQGIRGVRMAPHGSSLTGRRRVTGCPLSTWPISAHFSDDSLCTLLPLQPPYLINSFTTRSSCMTSWSIQTPQFEYYWLGSQKQQIITLIAELKQNPHRLHVKWVNNTRVILHTHLSAVSSTRTLLLCGMTSSSGVKRCLFSLSLSLIVFVGQFCLPALQSPAGSWRALVAHFTLAGLYFDHLPLYVRLLHRLPHVQRLLDPVPKLCPQKWTIFWNDTP